MAQIDVTEVLADPDFCDEIQLVSRTPQMNSRGENVITECPVNTVGSVQNASGRALQRLPEALRVANMSSFWVQGQIVASEPGKYSSVLIFRGTRYNVVTVFDWSNWGEGWCEGLCVAERPA